MLSERVRKIGLSPTLGVSALAARLREEGADVIDFSAGEPDFPTPSGAKRAGIAAIESDRTRYTANEGVAELRQAIAEKLERENGLAYGPQSILVSPGAKASLYFGILALVQPGDEVLIPTPHWVSYPEQVQLAGARAVLVETDEADGFKLDPGRLARAVTPRTRLLVLNQPCNPTGCCYDRDELAALAEVCVRHGLAVISDEIYERLVYDGREFTSLAAVNEELRERLLLVNGMSKTYSMTGWRIGYAAGPAEWISAMGRLQSHVTSNATSVAQWASLAALREAGEEVERRRLEFQRRRDVMHEGLTALDGVRVVRPGGAFYMLPNVSGCFGRTVDGKPVQSGDDVARMLLEHARVAVVPGEAFGSSRHVRLSYALSLERIREGVRRVAEVLGAPRG